MGVHFATVRNLIFYGFYCLLPIIITLGDIYLALLCIVINIVINMLFYCCTLRALYLDIFKLAAIFFLCVQFYHSMYSNGSPSVGAKTKKVNNNINKWGVDSRL
jgi:hypothetical protein